MKKFFSLVIALMAMTTSMQAQNVQLHYDLGHSLYDDLSNRKHPILADFHTNK